MDQPLPKAYPVLYASTLAFMVCFIVWMMFGVLGIPIREELGLSAFQFGLLTSTPVLTGAMFRLPLGIWTDRYGGRLMMTLLLVLCAVPVYFVTYAAALWQFLLIGLFLGLVGASFATSPASSRRPGVASPWASSAQAPSARRSICSSRPCCSTSTAGAWCRASMPGCCW